MPTKPSTPHATCGARIWSSDEVCRHAKRAASGSDYLLTGLIRCPLWGAMLGTRAHGRTRIYRYYSCYRLLADFYRHQQDP